METRLIRFSRGANSRRSYFVNRFLTANLGKTENQIREAIKTWDEHIDHPKHGPVSLEQLLSMRNQGFDDLLHWAISDFRFFSFSNRCLVQTAENLEICLLLDRLIQDGAPMGKNDGSTPGSILEAWKKKGELLGLRALAGSRGIPN